jgi:hypothetical protein
LFYRTDRALLYYYDGTRWLTTTLYKIIPTSVITPIPFTASPLSVAYMPPDLDYGMYLVDLQATSGVFGTNDGSNFWTVALKRRNATNTINSITSFDTSADTSSNWVTHDVAINAVLDASAKLIEVEITKTSAPDSLYLTSTLTYRLIG